MRHLGSSSLLRFSLRSALVLLTTICIVTGFFVERARQQQRAVEALLAVYAEIQYDCDTGARQTALERYKSIVVNCRHSVVWVVLDAPAANDETMEHLHSLPHLRVLMITEGSDVSSDGLAHLKVVPGLQHLVLASGRIDDRGLAHVASLPNLEELHIEHQRRITDQGIQQLAALNKLRRLLLIDTAVTESSISRLQKSLPFCEIEFFPE
jgi:hypothetical protein